MREYDVKVFTSEYCVNAINIKKPGNDVNRIDKTLFNSNITLTPHQIQAALFAFKSPLRKGVILADEVGLGKTIEAGIVIAQTYLEKKGKILIIAPASLMRQWKEELYDKFLLDAVILDRKLFNSKLKAGYANPIIGIKENVIICSYQMCGSLKEEIRNSRFDLVVIDEAHKLRNIHTGKNITSNNILYAIEHYKKVLLTATPIQNNLMDIYGLSTLIDNEIFGNKEIFKYNYIKNFDENSDDLDHRLKLFLHRTLRNQVQHYIKFTNRISKTYSFEMCDEEKQVYDKIRELLIDSDKETYLINKKQRHLMVLILCKLLGSSMNSIVATLSKMKMRLENIENNIPLTNEDLINDFDIDEFDLEDSLSEDDIDSKNEKIDLVQLKSEINNLNQIISLAKSVKNESKYTALLDSLEFSFKHLKTLGAEEKVLIFTESRQTQDYLYENLKKDGYDNVITYNGQNNSLDAKKILDDWMKLESNQEKIQNNRTINMKAAIIDKFKKDGQILIATEAGAEGLNLQFCSLVINYDLPWNPQRVEQRIGRCHRIGQKHDVVVINFVSKNNLIEQRIFELLHSKFRLFDEVLGASDSIVGTLDDGKDIEKSIIEIYQKCRTISEINEAFDNLQERYKLDIEKSLKETKEDLLNNFDEDIQNYFIDLMNDTYKRISDIERILIKLLRSNYDYNDLKFINENVFSIKGRKYTFSKDSESDAIQLNLNSEIIKNLISKYEMNPIKKGHIQFDISNYPYKLSRVEQLKGKKGIITINKLSIDSFEKEEFLLFNGILEDGTRLDSDLYDYFIRLDTHEFDEIICSSELLSHVMEDKKIHVESTIKKAEMENNNYLKDEIQKINLWADDKIQSIQLSVEMMRLQRKELQQESDLATNTQEKERIETEISKLSSKIKKSWLELAMAEDVVEDQRQNMITSLRKECMKETKVNEIFTVSFEVI